MNKILKEFSAKAHKGYYRFISDEKITPFVVMCRKRTGSNLLRSLINQHPRLLMHGEVFFDEYSFNFDSDGFRFFLNENKLLNKTNESLSNFLTDNVFIPNQKGVTHVGFKQFFFHPKSQWKSISSWVFEHEPKIIFLVRHPLESFISKQVALKREDWVDVTHKNVKPFEVELEILKTYLNGENVIRKLIDQYEGDKIIIQYKDLVDKQDKVLKHVSTFFDVENWNSAETERRKQIRRPYADFIINWKEVLDVSAKLNYIYDRGAKL